MPSPDTPSRLRLTVLCCDLVGSTHLSERFDPEDLREIVRDYQAVSVAAIERFAGRTAQYLGDGILCYFGYPEPGEDDAVRAVRAGLDIVAAITALNRRLESEWGTHLAVRIGIHSGSVATQEIERSRLIYGPTPEIAERLQRLAKADGVAVSAATRQQIRNAFECRSIGHVEGVGQPIEVFQVATSAPTAELAETADEGEAEHRQLTVMFCELAGRPLGGDQADDALFSSTELDLEDLSSNMRRFQTACARVVESFGGHIAQYLGEGLMVYFGYPVAHEDDARRAAHAGLGILEAVEQLNETVSEGSRMTVRLGLHTGPVVAGEVGAGETRERLALGSTPNVAARVQSLARPGDMILSQTTQRLVAGFFVLESRGSHSVKGISKPIELFRAIEKSDVRNPFEIALSRGLTPLEGRWEELALLAGRLRQAYGGRAQAALIQGEAGIGKSRLLYALAEHAAGHTRWTCRCSPYAQGSPLEPLIDLLQRILKLEIHKQDPERRVRSLETFLERLDLASDEAVALLAGLLSVPLPPRYPGLAQTPQRQKQRTLELVLEIIMQEARHGPLLFIVEDLHWIDPSTQEFLDLLLRRPDGRLLTVLAFRPSYSPPWSSTPVPLTEIALDRLSSAEAVAVVRHFTGGKALPAEVERQVVERADGIPLFVEELTKMVLESEALREDEDCYQLIGSLSALAIPTSVHDLLTARLDRLSSSRELVQWGAVIGRDFTHEMLQAVCELDEETLQEKLTRVLDTGLVLREEAASRVVYVFKHALIQDAAYGSLLRRQRRSYHGRVATVLTESFPEIIEQRPQVIAFHYTEAQKPEPAIDYWQLAGQRDFQRAAFPEAVGHLERGLALLAGLQQGPDRDQRELALQAALGSVHSSTRGFGSTEVEESFARAFAICQRIGDVPQLFWVLFGLWRFHFVRANYDRALELAEQLIRLASGSRDLDGELSHRLAAHFSVGATLHCRGQFAPALDHLERAIAISRRDRVHHDAAQTGQDSGVASRCWAAMTLYFLGYPDRARRLCEDAVAQAERIGHAFTHTYALNISGYVAYYRRDRQSLKHFFEQVVEQARAQGSFWEPLAETFLGWAGADRQQLRQGFDGYLSSGSRLQRPQIYAALAEVALWQGDAEQARRDLERARAAIDETGERYFEAEVLRIRGEVALLDDSNGSNDSNDSDNGTGRRRAEEHFRQSLAVATEQGNQAIALRTTTSLCRLLRADNRMGEARELLAQAYGELTEGFDTPDLQQARELFATLDSGTGVDG